MKLNEQKLLLYLHTTLTIFALAKLSMLYFLEAWKLLPTFFASEAMGENFFTRLGLFFLFFGSACMMLGVPTLYGLYSNPSKRILKQIDLEVDDGMNEVVSKLSKAFEVPQPKILCTSSEKVSTLSLPFSSKEDAIIISKRFLSQLENDEMESVIAHELWYIKFDMGRVLRSFFYKAEYLLFPLAGAPNLFVASLIFSKIGIFASDLYILSSGYLLFLFVLMVSDTILYKQELMEYYADLASSVITKKPKALISAIKQAILLKLIESKLFSRKESFISKLGRLIDGFLHTYIGRRKIESWREVA